jgi:hypothetical protein
MERTLERLFAHNPMIRRLLILLITAVLGMIDLATGYEYSFSVFYLLPVSIAAWYDHAKDHRSYHFAVSNDMVIADIHAGHLIQTHHSLWNTFVRLGLFSIVAFC